MKTILSSDDFKDVIMVKEVPDNFTDVGGLVEMSFSTSILGISGSKNAIAFDGIYVENNEVYLPEDVSVQVKKDTPHLELHFELEGFTSFSDGKSGNEKVVIPEGHGLLIYLPELDGTLNFAKNKNRKSLEIEFSEDYLLTMFNNDLEILGDFGNAIQNKTPNFFNNASFKISKEIYRLISDIVGCKYHGILKKIYVEAKVREVFLAFIECKKSNGKIGWKNKDNEKLYAAKEIIEQNLSSPYTIVELSKFVGLNDFKLKKGFKEKFGNTIFGYINQLRMQEAKILLENTEQSISDISYHVGFKNPQHFTIAFKRMYGILPKNIKK